MFPHILKYKVGVNLNSDRNNQIPLQIFKKIDKEPTKKLKYK